MMRAIVCIRVPIGIFKVFGASGHGYQVFDGTIDTIRRDAESLLGGVNSDLFEIIGFRTVH